VVAKRKIMSKQTKKLVTVKQEGTPKQPPYKLKPPPTLPKKQAKDANLGLNQKPPATCESCGIICHVSTD
jgi:hypothetical protein